MYSSCTIIRYDIWSPWDRIAKTACLVAARAHINKVGTMTNTWVAYKVQPL